MPQTTPRTPVTVAALILGLCATASASFAPDSAPSDPSAQYQSEQSVQMLAINDAVEATKDDPSAMCFVVAIPENYEQARQVRDLWTSAKNRFDHDKHQVFFVRGQDAQFVLENSFINSTPAFIAYRNGRPYHSRTGTLSESNLESFLALSFDNSAPTTNAPDQTRYLYDSMTELAHHEKTQTAAQGACSIMLNLHALIHGPYASTYSDQDLEAMTSIYNQSQLALYAMDTSDNSVLDQIDATRAMAMKTWNKRTDSTFGIGIWMDLSKIANKDDEILDWIDEGIENPVSSKRVAQSLADYGSSVASLLIKNHRYEALAMTISSPDQVEGFIAGAQKLSDDIASINGESSTIYRQHIENTTDRAAAYHAALLISGRTIQAWQVAQLTEDFAGPELASASICRAAIDAGVLGQRHAQLAKNLDKSEYASLINIMNTSFAIVPTDD